MVLIFLDIVRQHLQNGCLHGTETPLKYGGDFDIYWLGGLWGSLAPFSLALTRVLPKSFVFLRLRQGLGIHCCSSVVV